MIRLRTALMAYAALAILSSATLRGKLLAVSLIVLAGITLKTVLHELRQRQLNSDQTQLDSDQN